MRDDQEVYQELLTLDRGLMVTIGYVLAAFSTNWLNISSVVSALIPILDA